MSRSFVGKFALPGIGVAIAAGAALASNHDAIEAAYAPAPSAVMEDAAAAAAGRLFERADLNADGALDRDEYRALAIVTAELASLNGFVSLEIDGAARALPLPAGSPKSLSRAERVRIDAVASRAFHAASGADIVIDKSEFIAEARQNFRAADRNRNGVLNARELQTFAAATSRLNAPEA